MVGVGYFIGVLLLLVGRTDTQNTTTPALLTYPGAGVTTNSTVQVVSSYPLSNMTQSSTTPVATTFPPSNMTQNTTTPVSTYSPTVSRESATTPPVLTYPPSSLTQEEKDTFLDTHNKLRAQVIPEAADMKYMEWDDSLADMAQAWSEKCIWGHGFPVPNLTPYKSIGQNLYLITGYDYRPSGQAVSRAWFNEIRYYNFEEISCTPGKMCGHYTQLAWASSYVLGCAMAFCKEAAETEHDEIWLVTCHYSPGGNFNGQRPYKAGMNCTKCDSGVGECYNSLCRPCADHTEECVCSQKCASCGKLNSETCSCKCPNGFTGTDCADICQDFNTGCGLWNVYPKKWCEDGHKNQGTMYRLCPASCKLCVAERDPDFYCPDFLTPTPQTTMEPGQPTNSTLEPQPTTGTEVTTPAECVKLECKNEGVVLESCECKCTTEFQGKECQHSREEARYGVVVILSAGIEQWDIMEPVLINIIADGLTTRCNDNFELCCPGKGPKTIPELPFANESNVAVGDGYPEPTEAANNTTFSVMFLAKGLDETELCLEGGAQQSRHRRSSSTKADSHHAVYTRATNPGIYLNQSILLEVIKNSTTKMAQGLEDIGITASIVGIRAGTVEPLPVTTDTPTVSTKFPPTPPKPHSGLSPGVIVAIVVGSAALLAVCVGVAVVVICKMSKQKGNRVKPLQDTISLDSYDSHYRFVETKRGLTTVAHE